jgi:hypothetical protein
VKFGSRPNEIFGFYLEREMKNGSAFYNIVDGKRSSLGGTVAALDPSTGRHLAAVPDIDRE